MRENLIGNGPQFTFYRLLAVTAIGLIVGTISSFATIGFVEAVHWLNKVLFISGESRALVGSAKLTFITIAVLTIGGLVVGLILHYGVDGGKALNSTESIYAVQFREKLPSPTSGFFSTLASILSLGCGASVGQYSPLVYMGSLIGQMTNQLSLGLRDIRSITIACGVAAAISTAFNAPIAGLIFTHEVIIRHYSLRIFTAVTVATACGYVVANVAFQHPPLFLITIEPDFHTVEFFLFALEGMACGLLAVLFMKLLEKMARLSAWLKIHAIFKPMLAGFIMAIVALEIPEVLGAGQDVLGLATLAGGYQADELALILFAKILVTALCIGFGFAGGVISPSLLIGALFGALFAILIPEVILDDYSGLSVYAICGMVALASPVIGAPLTALLIIFELTRNYEITIAAMVTIVFASMVSYHWYGRSLFDTQLLGRGFDLSHGRERAYLQHQKIANYASDKIPTINHQLSCQQARKSLLTQTVQSAVIIDDDSRYVGMLHMSQLQDANDDNPVSTLALKNEIVFDENTSLWHGMETMRDYIGDAIPVAHSQTRVYLGALPESVVISAYLDAIHDLRREEHEA